MRLSSLALTGLLLSSAVGGQTSGVAARSQAAACSAGTSLLLVQTPKANLIEDGLEDGLRVIDGCGAETGSIDVPSPAFVWPTAKSGVAIVQSGGATRFTDAEPGPTYLVDAGALTATRLEIPPLPAEDVWGSQAALTRLRSPRHALVGVTGEEARIYLVDLGTGHVTDVLAELPAGILADGGVDAAWVDPTSDTVVLLQDGPRISEPVVPQVVAPVADVGAAVSVEGDNPFAPGPYVDDCRRVLGGDEGAALYACEGDEGGREWRTRRDEGSDIDPIDGLSGFDLVPVTETWSTGLAARPFAYPSVSLDGAYVSGRDPHWLLFAAEDPRGGDLYVKTIDDLADLSVVDVPGGGVTPIAGLPAGRGALHIYGSVDGGPLALALWMPWSEEDDGLFADDDVTLVELVANVGELYLLDLGAAEASLLGDAMGGAISPDGRSIATMGVDVAAIAGELRVGPVAGELVEVGPGFGTWLTP